MESRRCVPRSRDAHEAIRQPPESDGHPRPLLTVSHSPTGRSQHGDQGQEHKEEHGEEASSEDAEGEAAGKEGQEVAERRSWAINAAARILVLQSAVAVAYCGRPLGR